MDSAFNLEQFMKSRGIPDEIINVFSEEHIDREAILHMEDDDLKKFLPRYGDRVALKTFCSRNVTKCSLIERLQAKLGHSKVPNFDKESHTKKDRLVEIGWLCFDDKKGKMCQMRSNCGGGTRKIYIDQNVKCTEILKRAKELFFPNGVSVRGKVDDFEITLLDFKHYPIDLNLTVKNIFEITAVTRLRFYLASQQKTQETCEIHKTSTSVPNSSDLGNLPSTSSEKDRDFYNLLNFEDDYPHGAAENNTAEYSDTNSTNIEGAPNSTVNVYQDQPSVSSDPLNHVIDDDAVLINPSLDENIIEYIFEDEPEDGATKLIMHRGRVFYELLEAFQQPLPESGAIVIEMISPNGEPEVAADEGGVFRDAISEFWTSFYDICTVGANLKVPFLRDDFGQQKWEAIGKILLRSWIEEKYFPIKLAPTFVKSFLEIPVKDEEIIQDFLEYISESEATMIRSALDDYSPYEEELIEFFMNFGTKRLPKKENLKQLLIDVAHKELIQKPAFVAQCFEMCKHLKGFDLKKVYSDLNPSAKNILKVLTLDDTCQFSEAKIIFNYLKKFVRESDFKTRSSFLRFATGSNVLLKHIKVSVIPSGGFGRVPVAHTCAGLLEIPNSYENYVVFRNEFNTLLSSNVWIMDIV